MRIGDWPLASAAAATTIRVRGGEVQRSDGSFADPMNRIAGFNILEYASAEEAVDVAQRHPVAKFGSVEIRRMVE